MGARLGLRRVGPPFAGQAQPRVHNQKKCSWVRKMPRLLHQLGRVSCCDVADTMEGDIQVAQFAVTAFGDNPCFQVVPSGHLEALEVHFLRK